jgi:alpha-D-ribose 1-methylphosphonate 5-triphosphate synthase subunit PhnL
MNFKSDGHGTLTIKENVGKKPLVRVAIEPRLWALPPSVLTSEPKARLRHTILLIPAINPCLLLSLPTLLSISSLSSVRCYGPIYNLMTPYVW